MSARRPLVLLPPSKGKAVGGGGPAYADTLDRVHPLAVARRQVLEALEGERSGRLHLAPTMPAHRRYTGVVHGNAGLADVVPRRTGVDVRIVSPLLGLARLDDLVPAYRLEFAGRLPALGGLAGFWRRELTRHLAASGRGRRIWDLLPAEHGRVWDAEVRRDLDVVGVAFLRPDGRPANAARAKVAKGRFAAALLQEPTLTPTTACDVVDLGHGWSLQRRGDGLAAIFRG